jgi:hypothetical protein
MYKWRTFKLFCFHYRQILVLWMAATSGHMVSASCLALSSAFFYIKIYIIDNSICSHFGNYRSVLCQCFWTHICLWVNRSLRLLHNLPSGTAMSNVFFIWDLYPYLHLCVSLVVCHDLPPPIVPHDPRDGDTSLVLTCESEIPAYLPNSQNVITRAVWKSWGLVTLSDIRVIRKDFSYLFYIFPCPIQKHKD